MSKQSQATATATEVKEPSLVFKIKEAFLHIYAEVKAGNVVFADTAEWLQAGVEALGAEIASKQTKGLPLSEQLEKAETRRNELYASWTPAAHFGSPELDAEVDALTAKIARIKRDIAKANAASDESAPVEDDTSDTVED